PASLNAKSRCNLAPHTRSKVSDSREGSNLTERCPSSATWLWRGPFRDPRRDPLRGPSRDHLRGHRRRRPSSPSSPPIRVPTDAPIEAPPDDSTASSVQEARDSTSL